MKTQKRQAQKRSIQNDDEETGIDHEEPAFRKNLNSKKPTRAKKKTKNFPTKPKH